MQSKTLQHFGKAYECQAGERNKSHKTQEPDTSGNFWAQYFGTH